MVDDTFMLNKVRLQGGPQLFVLRSGSKQLSAKIDQKDIIKELLQWFVV